MSEERRDLLVDIRNHVDLGDFTFLVDAVRKRPSLLWEKFVGDKSIVRYIVYKRMDRRDRTLFSEEDVIGVLYEFRDIANDYAFDHDFSEKETYELLLTVFNEASKDFINKGQQPYLSLSTAFRIAADNCDANIVRWFLDNFSKDDLFSTTPYSVSLEVIHWNLHQMDNAKIFQEVIAVLTILDEKDFLLKLSYQGYPCFVIIFDSGIRDPFFAFVILREPETLAAIVRYYTERRYCPPGVSGLIRDVITIWTEETNRQLTKEHPTIMTPDFSASLIPGSIMEGKIRELLDVQRQVFEIDELLRVQEIRKTLIEETVQNQHPEFNLPSLVVKEILEPETRRLHRR